MLPPSFTNEELAPRLRLNITKSGLKPPNTNISHKYEGMRCQIFLLRASVDLCKY